jgi:predicted XRE-type DNA-binding protein
MTTQAFDSVWDALEDDLAERANLKLRSALMIEISEYYRKSGLTQKEAAKRLGTTQPRLNDVLKGRIEKCTVDRLVNMLASVGYKLDLKVSHAA